MALSGGCAELVRGDNHYVLDDETDDGSGPSGGGAGSSGHPVACDSGLTACGDACVVLASDPENCGWCGHDCQGASCDEGTCAAVELAGGIDDPHDLAVDGSHVYWTAGGTVQRASKKGHVKEMVAVNQASPDAIVVDSMRLLWADEGSGRLMRLNKDEMGKPPKALFSAPANSPAPVGLAIEGGLAYFFCHDTAHADLCAVKANGGGGGDKEESLVTDQPHPSQVRTLGQYLVWSGDIAQDDDSNGNNIPDGQEGIAGGYVRVMPAQGGEVRALASGEGAILRLTASSEVAVWADATNRRIRMSAVSDGEPKTLVEDQDVRGLAADDEGVVWSTAGGSVKSRALTGGPVRVLASDIQDVGAVALDGSQVYFLRSGAGGAVLRVAR